MGSALKIHFMYELGATRGFAENLEAELGQTALEASDAVVSVGGDGGLLQALRKGRGKKVCGIMPPDSNSRGFWTNKDIETAAALIQTLQESPAYPIKPLKAVITFVDGSQATRLGYNDISVRSVHQALSADLRTKYDLEEIDVGIQSALMNLRAVFKDAAIGPMRIMGSGIVFATPLGSTAMNGNYNGPSIDIRNEGIVLTGIGISEPVKGFNSIVNTGDAVFEVTVKSAHKRPVMMTFDSFGVVCNKQRSPIARMQVAIAQEGTAHLVLNSDPGTRAYAAMNLG
jgi:NAD kinase